MGLETHFPQPTIVKTAIGEILITALTLKKIPSMARAIAPFWAIVSSADKNQSDLFSTILTVIDKHFDDVMNALSIAIDKPVTQLETLGLDDAVELISAVAIVNMDFFSRRLVPRLGELAKARNKTHGIP